MIHTHVDDRMLTEISEADRLDRLGRILQALEARDGPRFNFYYHEQAHEQRLSSVR